MTKKKNLERRAITTGLALSLALGPTLPGVALAATTTNDDATQVELQATRFSDVDYFRWYALGVTYCANHGIMTGYEGTTRFGVGDNLTTEQLAQIVWNLAEPQNSGDRAKKYVANTTGMSDVQDYQWYTGAMNWAKANGIITGYDGSNRMGVGENVSAERFVTVMARYLSKGAADAVDDARVGSLFQDGDSVSSWARKSIVWSYDSGLLTGYDLGGGVFRIEPLEHIARERAATILMRASKSGLLDTSAHTITHENTFTVTFDPNGGLGLMDPLTVEVGKKTLLTRSGFHRAGYRFRGWSLSKDGSPIFSDGQEIGDIVSPGENITLYAVWEPIHL